MGWLDDYFTAWSEGDADAVTSFMADDIDYQDTAQDKRWIGTDAVRGEVEHAHGQGVTFELVRSFEGPDHFCAEWVMQPHGIRAVSVGVIEDGRIASVTDYWNNPRPAGRNDEDPAATG